jgi:hypothetical protein
MRSFLGWSHHAPKIRNYILKTYLKYASFILILGAPLQAEEPVVELIDIPTAEVVDHYGVASSFRFYTEGGVLTKAAFGVFPRLNIGFGLDAQRFIGNRSTDLNRPTLNVKLRAFDGSRNLPALALGFDGQGYFFNKTTDKYDQREKGLYVVGSGEVVVPGLSLHGGLNMFDFKDDRIYGFTGVQYLFDELLGLVFEADNMFYRPRDIRLNVDNRYYVTPNFSLDLAGRDLWAGSRKTERILRITYSASF